MGVYKDFRRVEKIGAYKTFSKRFDEPTYLSFLLKFGDGDSRYNYATSNTYYDNMPHPLFIQRDKYIPLEERENYAAIDYLFDANEPTRVGMLSEFIDRWNQLQTTFQWYFQRIDGLEQLLKVNPKKGKRIPDDARLTINCLEGLDLKMSYLLNLYRKIVWDDTYQRWVLPDMMRYFSLDIYITEFRTFHLPNQQNEMGFGQLAPGKTSVDPVTGQTPLMLYALDKILPTWKISCKMCEFDLEGMLYDHIQTLSVVDEPQPTAVTFRIKVGNIEETQIYPLFTSMYLEDKRINGKERSSDLNSTLANPDKLDDLSQPGNDNRGYNTDLLIGQSRLNDDESHGVGQPFNEMTQIDFQGSKNLTTDITRINPTEPNTWIGNGLTLGKAFVSNLVEDTIDKVKITPIPGLGTSFNELVSAIESKDIMTALGLVRKSITTVTNEHIMPSQNLSNEIVDATFKQFLTGVTLSKATNSYQLELQAAANTALNDNGIWEKLKDFSLATNLVGPNETNIPKKIEGGSNLQAAIQSSATAPTELKSVQIITGTPSSQLSNKIISG